MAKEVVNYPGPVGKDWEYVEVPEKNLLGKPHEGGALNTFDFKAGNKYYVPPDVAGSMRRILAKYDGNTLRQIRPDTDAEAYAQLRSVGREIDNIVLPG